jgi:hypothetical protein
MVDLKVGFLFLIFCSNPVESRQEVGRCINGKNETGARGQDESPETTSIPLSTAVSFFCRIMTNFVILGFRK